MVNDPISDFLSRIRNAQLRKKKKIEVPSTKILVSISEILKQEGFINDFAVVESNPQNELTVHLKYVNGSPVIRDLVRVSKPGVRRYRGYKDIEKVRSGMGVAVYSTPNGVLTGNDAIKQKIGGEFLCYIY